MLFFFFFSLSFSRTDENEYQLYDIAPGIGEKDISHEDDKMPSSKQAFCTVYSADDHWNHFRMSVLVLGHSLSILSPKFDRVLILPSSLEFDPIDMKKITAVWTHIIRRPFVKFVCEKENERMKNPKDAQIWFKLQAFSLHQYDRVIYISPQSFIVRDISDAFEFYPPAAPPDYQTWGYSHLGAVRNLDFFVLAPTEWNLGNITKKACEWIGDPIGRMREIHKTFISDRNKPLGPYDNGLLEDYYYGRLTTMPAFYQYEITDKNGPIPKTDPRIRTYRFSFGKRPWDNGPQMSSDPLIQEAWIRALIKTYEDLNDTIELSRFQLPKPIDDESNFLTMHWEKPVDEPQYKVIEFYDDFEETSIWRVIIRFSSLVLGGLGLIGFAVVDAPKSSRDDKNLGLMDDE